MQPYFLACLMTETKQWVTLRNIRFVDDFCLLATVICNFERTVCPINLCHDNVIRYIFKRQHLTFTVPLWDYDSLIPAGTPWERKKRTHVARGDMLLSRNTMAVDLASNTPLSLDSHWGTEYMLTFC